MYLRYKNYKSDPFAREVKVISARHMRWYFWGKDEGVCNVNHLGAIEELLKTGQVVPAYEKYGLVFDAKGFELKEDNGVSASAQPLFTKTLFTKTSADSARVLGVSEVVSKSPEWTGTHTIRIDSDAAPVEEAPPRRGRPPKQRP